MLIFVNFKKVDLQHSSVGSRSWNRDRAASKLVSGAGVGGHIKMMRLRGTVS
jgi:hypothetical protein